MIARKAPGRAFPHRAPLGPRRGLAGGPARCGAACHRAETRVNDWTSGRIDVC
ncbi:hypothetical protein ALSL_0247 [Aerosticca soli]|uniref:Uncharacterized protein n=1 Tax=Aerosticca soli TaxID=2010829 RepID=A0A2Z6E2V9_9GAMM|nr:hypothetical protein ALSL_0247 [Aerosticca soli]